MLGGLFVARKKGNVGNLKPVKSTEEARERGRKGGLKTQQIKRERRKAKECMNMILSLNATGKKSKEMMSNLGIEDEEQQNIMLLMSTMFMKAASTGDANAIAKILEIAGDFDADLRENQISTININIKPATESDVVDD